MVRSSESRIRNDLALLEVYPPFVMNDFVKEISLPKEEKHVASGFCWIAGKIQVKMKKYISR
jgi:hypothetical protein